ncbi:MAG: PH domain-containing protein [Muribaculaceae bacterium]|nr:PH domain-containing protein [Muribaculaceae bacterium]
MKEKVVISAGSIVWTCIVFLFLCSLILHLLSRGLETISIIFSACLVIWCLACLWYAPMYISLSADTLSIHRSLCIKDIPVSEIKSVHLHQPTMAERRLCGSGGMFGYWGWFFERPVGKYFAYYGKASDCFLVELRNGRKYLLGCRNAPAIVKALTTELKK